MPLWQSFSLDLSSSSSSWVILVVLLVLVLVYVAVAVLVISSLLIRPPFYPGRRRPSQGLAMEGAAIDAVWRPYVHNPREDFGLDYADVAFPTPLRDDNEEQEGSEWRTLRGWHVPCTDIDIDIDTPRVKFGVITLHGGGRDRREFHRFLPFLHRAQLEVLLIDFREHGISDGNGNGLDWGKYMYLDVLAAAKFAKETLGWTKVICLGTSNGAAMSILAASYDKSGYIDAVVADSAYSSAREGMRDILASFLSNYPRGRYLSLLHWVVPSIVFLTMWRLGLDHHTHGITSRLYCVKHHPIFLIHGTADIRFGPKHAETLYNETIHQSKELWIVKGAKHTEVYDTAPQEYERRLLDFIRSYVGEWRAVDVDGTAAATQGSDASIHSGGSDSSLSGLSDVSFSSAVSSTHLAGPNLKNAATVKRRSVKVD